MFVFQCFQLLFGQKKHRGLPTFVIKDGFQKKIELASNYRSIIAATFSHFFLLNIGGSETFEKKQDYFYTEIRKQNETHFRKTVYLTIYRDKLLESSMKATQGLSVSSWCKHFNIKFFKEEGKVLKVHDLFYASNSNIIFIYLNNTILIY